MSRYFDYLFYVDLEASMADPISQNALEHLKVSFLSPQHMRFPRIRVNMIL